MHFRKTVLGPPFLKIDFTVFQFVQGGGQLDNGWHVLLTRQAGSTICSITDKIWIHSLYWRDWKRRGWREQEKYAVVKYADEIRWNKIVLQEVFSKSYAWGKNCRNFFFGVKISIPPPGKSGKFLFPPRNFSSPCILKNQSPPHSKFCPNLFSHPGLWVGCHYAPPDPNFSLIFLCVLYIL